jgi:hypothetical protein
MNGNLTIAKDIVDTTTASMGLFDRQDNVNTLE